MSRQARNRKIRKRRNAQKRRAALAAPPAESPRSLLNRGLKVQNRSAVEFLFRLAEDSAPSDTHDRIVGEAGPIG